MPKAPPKAEAASKKVASAVKGAKTAASKAKSTAKSAVEKTKSAGVEVEAAVKKSAKASSTAKKTAPTKAQPAATPSDKPAKAAPKTTAAKSTPASKAEVSNRAAETASKPAGKPASRPTPSKPPPSRPATKPAKAAKGASAKDDTTAAGSVVKVKPAPRVPTTSTSAFIPVVITGKPMSKQAIANDPFLSKQQEILQAERVEYLSQAAALRAEVEQMAADAEPGDTQFDEESGEGTTAAVDREHNLQLVSQAMATVEQIDRALVKMGKGTYGLCEHCGLQIAEARLEALPFAALCVQCKSGGLTRR